MTQNDMTLIKKKEKEYIKAIDKMEEAEKFYDEACEREMPIGNRQELKEYYCYCSDEADRVAEEYDEMKKAAALKGMDLTGFL